MSHLPLRKLLALTEMEDGEIDALEAGQSVLGITLDDVDRMPPQELRAALRRERARREKQVAKGREQVAALEEQVEDLQERLAGQLDFAARTEDEETICRQLLDARLRMIRQVDRIRAEEIPWRHSEVTVRECVATAEYIQNLVLDVLTDLHRAAIETGVRPDTPQPVPGEYFDPKFHLDLDAQAEAIRAAGRDGENGARG